MAPKTKTEFLKFRVTVAQLKALKAEALREGRNVPDQARWKLFGGSRCPAK
jgi:hypothetical protein